MAMDIIEEYIEFTEAGGRGPGGDELRRKAKEHLIVACKKYQLLSSTPPRRKSTRNNTAALNSTTKTTAASSSRKRRSMDGNGSDDGKERSTALDPLHAPRSQKWRRLSEIYAELDALKKSAAAKKKPSATASSRVLQPRPKDGDKTQAALVPSSACQPSRARTILAVLMEKNILRPTAKLSYRRTKRGPPVKQGTVTHDGAIQCACGCGGKAFTVAEFAEHASGANTERPCGSVFLGDRRSLSQCLVQLMRADGKKKRGSPSQPQRARVKRKCGSEHDDGDSVCSVCADGGNMLLCDCCPSAFHHGCVGLETTPQGAWFCPPCRCAICDSGELDDSSNFTDKTMIYCNQCEREHHVGCIRSRGNQLECRPEEPWLCSHDCSNIFHSLQGLVGRSIPTSVEGLKFTVLKSSKLPEEEGMAAEEHGKLCMAFDVLHECFVTLIEPQTQSDLSHDIVFNRESWLRRLNFRGFYVVGLEKGGELITVGTLRVYGKKVAELPLVGTRFAYRRQGMCHLLMNQLEKLLGELGVERLVLPSVSELLETWTGSFGFNVMTQSHKMEIAEHTILYFQGTTMCHKFINKAAALQR